VTSGYYTHRVKPAENLKRRIGGNLDVEDEGALAATHFVSRRLRSGGEMEAET
jgi:hypothetical protein